MEEQKQIRCAIYTRKSTDEGLEKEFNILQDKTFGAVNPALGPRYRWMPKRWSFTTGKIPRN